METLTLGLFQFNIFWENKDANLRFIREETEKFFKKNTIDILILPEMFTTGFSMNAEVLSEELLNSEEKTLRFIVNLAKKHGIAVAGSWITKEDNRFYNTLHFVTPEGKIEIYHKHFLFRPGGETEVYSRGEKQLITEYKGWKLYFQICYDLRFPEWARNYDLKYDIGINVANWPSLRSNQWKSLIQARAIENQAYFVGVNRTGKDANNLFYSGNSLVADYTGKIPTEILHENLIAKTVLQKTPLEAFRRSFPVWKDFPKEGF